MNYQIEGKYTLLWLIIIFSCSLSSFGIRSGDTIYVLNSQNKNPVEAHITHLNKWYGKGVIRVQPLPSQI